MASLPFGISRRARAEHRRVDRAVTATVAEAKRCFAICRTCEHSRDDGFACDLYHGCFGKYRSDQASQCPIAKWPKRPANRPAD